jgi:hypothetical protein
LRPFLQNPDYSRQDVRNAPAGTISQVEEMQKRFAAHAAPFDEKALHGRHGRGREK